MDDFLPFRPLIHGDIRREEYNVVNRVDSVSISVT